MLNEQMKSQLKEYFNNIKKPVRLIQHGDSHDKTNELKDMLTQIAELSGSISYESSPSENTEENDGITFHVTNEEGASLVFRGIPGGHEFSSLVLAILHSGGHKPKLDESIQKMVKKIKQPLNFETVVSLDCHNCPEVVQSLNTFATLNQNISHTMIDGALYPDVVNDRNVQGVPAVFLNGESFANGKIDAGTVIEKLMSLDLQLDESGPEESGQTDDTLYDVAVLGGGPAGVSAAVYSARKGLKVLMIADRPGGQVKDTMGIENLISVASTTGPELSNVLIDQVKNHEVTLRQHVRVERIEAPDDVTLPRKMHLNTGDVLQSKTIIVATGARWRELGVPGEKENLGKGVAYCPHCDGPFFKGKTVAVIGGGNSGVEAALDLSGIVKQVHVVEFMDELKADKVLVDRLKATSNITVTTSAKTEEIISDGKSVKSLNYLNRQNESKEAMHVDGVFVQIGLVPNSQFLEGVVERNKYGEIIVNERCETNAKGVFACGDVTTVPYKQIVIAMGEGSKASLSAFDYLLRLPSDKKDTVAA